MKIKIVNIIFLFFIYVCHDVLAVSIAKQTFIDSNWEETLSKINIDTAPLGKFNIEQNSPNNYSGSLRGMTINFTSDAEKVTHIECKFPSHNMHVHRGWVIDLASILMKEKVKSSRKVLSRFQNHLYKLKKDGDTDNINVDGLNINMSRSNDIIIVTIN